MSQGIDFAWGRPNPSDITAQGYTFVGRYYGSDSSKRLTKQEAANYGLAGLQIVAVWEDAANAARNGANAGTADGTTARAQADAAMHPMDRPIYAAADYDAPEADWPAIAAYLDAFGRATGRPVGIYGPRALVDRMIADGHATYGWISAGWDDHEASPAHLKQNVQQVTIDGVACDVNDALATDIGGWTPFAQQPAPAAPPPPVQTYPGDNMTRHPLVVVTDANGNGDNVLDGRDADHPLVPFSSVEAVFPNGSDPEANHAYGPIARLSVSDCNGATKVEVEGGPLNGQALVFVLAAA